jgi:hypothetical protein
MKKGYIIFAFLTILFFVGANLDVDAQCAMCRAQLETSGANPNAKNTGINSGILYLMLCPYLLIGGIACAWYYSNKKKKAQLTA